MKMTKRLLSLVLVLVMLFGMFPAQANAATTEHEHDPGEATTTDVQTQATTGAVMVEHDGETTYYADLQSAFNGFAPGNNTYGGKYVVTLLADNNGNLNMNLQYPTETLDIILDLNGHTITGDGTTIAVAINYGSKNSAGCKFTIRDSSGDNSGKITGGKGGVKLDGMGSFLYFEGGTITGNHGASKGGGILMGATAKLIMTGGVITGNSVTGSSSANSGYGGGVLANYADILGGEIYNNAAYKGSHVQSGRGGGVCTDFTGTAGYCLLRIADGIVHDNIAENAGDDVMAQGNGSKTFALVIGTEKWYIDGWNGTKGSAGNGEADRYDETNPVPYTDGGFGTVNDDGSYTGVKNKTIGLKYDSYDGPVYKITYTDGVDDAVVFEDQTYLARPGKATPAFQGMPSRIGYVFDGWSPEVPETPSEDMTFVAKWVALPAYTVTYTDGVEGEEVFADQVYNTYEGYATPAFEGTPTREHYIFTGWTPELVDTVTATVVYAATWREAAVYTITYTDGVEDEEIFPDQVYTVEEQQPTPKYSFAGKREDYKFSKWNPTVATLVTGDATYTAVWVSCTHSWGTGVFDEETLSTTYTCSYCGKVKVEYAAAEIDGTYYTTLQAALTAVQSKTGNVTIKVLSDVEGAFTFNWTAMLATMKLNLTIDLNGHTITGTGAASVLTVKKAKTNNAVLNLIIEDSSAEKTGTITGGKGTNGGAIVLTTNIKKTDSLTINGGNFKNNTATGNGGAVACTVSGFGITINGGVFENNTATGYGGAVSAPNVTITGGTFTGNTAKSTSVGGGAVYSGGTLTISNGTFTGNTAVNGGAIYVTTTKPVVNITGGKIYGNTATGYGDDIVFKCTGTSAPTFNLMAAADMEVEGISNWYVDGFCGSTSAGTTDRFSETVKIYAKPSSLTKSTIALKAASHYTVTYTDGAEGEEIFADQVILVGAGCATPAFDGELVRDGFTFTGWTPAVADSVTADATYTATWKENAKGAINGVTFRGDNEGLSVELENLLAHESVQVKVYFGETLLTTVSWRDEYIEKGVFCEFLTASVRTGEEESTQWAATEWTAYVNQVPTKLELYIDGTLMDELALELDAQMWASQAGVRVPVMGEIIRAWLNPVNGRLMVDLENLGFEQSVVLELYSGETLLTSSSLNTAEYGSAIYEELTGNIGVQDYTASDTWPCQEWTAWDDVVPTAVKLVVDGQTVSTCENIQINGESGMTALTAETWASFPGTPVRVYGDINGVAFRGDNEGVSLELHDVLAYETIAVKVYSGETLLTTVSLRDIEANKQFLGSLQAELTVSIRTYDESTSWAATEWIPMNDVVPTKYELYVDGILLDTHEETVDAQKWSDLKGTATARPDAPVKLGENVTPDLIRIICDSDPEHAPVNVKWQFQSTEVYPGAVTEWNEELGTWTVKVRIDSVSVYYVWMNYEKKHNDIRHTMVDEDQQCINTYLKWDEESQLWVHLDEKPIEVHVNCETAPVAPTNELLGTKSYQIHVMGDLDGDGIYGENGYENNRVFEMYATTIPADAYTIGEVYGSRKDGFFVDVTVTLKDGDIFLTNWIEKHASGEEYIYNWEKTSKTFNFTLEYTGDLSSTLLGDGLNDWVNAATGDGFGKIGEAYVIPAPPAAPKQQNVTEQLVAVICDSDGQRHETVYGKWYPQHCKTTADMVWSDELQTWTVDVRIGSLYIMYVDQLEDANYGTVHELVEDITTVYSTLKWDAEQQLWVPMEAIELHTTCRTAPVAPAYNQLEGYQIKVKGDMDGDGIWGETTATNNRVKEQYTTDIAENGYTISKVYGSREEGFFVDITVTLADGDIYLTNWTAQCDPCRTYAYDWTRTEKTVTFTLKYNGSLNGTLYGDRHASNTNYDWVLDNGKTYGVVAEAYAVVDPNGPTYHEMTSVVTAPTCTEPGYTTHTCGVCGEVVVDTEVEALGHDWSDWTVVKEPTLTAEGKKERHCLREDCDCVDTAAIPVLEPLATPTITKLENTEKGIKITWGAVEGAERYRVYIKNGNAWKVVGNTTETGYVYTGVESGKSYTFTIRCVNDENTICTSNYNTTGWKKTFVAQPAITDLSSTAKGVQITWNAVPGAERYRVYVKSGNAWKVLGNTTGTGFLWTGAETNKTYTFTIRCVDADNKVSTSAYNTTGWSHKYYPAPVITKFENLENGIKITWGAINGAERYRVYVKSGNAWKVLDNTTETSYVWTGAESGKTYTFTVRCVDADNTYAISSYNHTGWERKYVAQPAIAKMESKPEGIQITWNAVPGADQYRVYVRSGNTWKILTNTTGTSFLWTGAEAGKTYTFTIRCVDAENKVSTSSYNTTGWRHTYYPTPAITKLESTAEGIQITWDAINGAERYRVYVKNGKSWKVIGTPTENGFLWTGAEAGKTYTFTVRSVDADNTVCTSNYNSTGWTIKHQ